MKIALITFGLIFVLTLLVFYMWNAVATAHIIEGIHPMTSWWTALFLVILCHALFTKLNSDD